MQMRYLPLVGGGGYVVASHSQSLHDAADDVVVAAEKGAVEK